MNTTTSNSQSVPKPPPSSTESLEPLLNAFNGLTSAIHQSSRKRRLLTIIGGVILVLMLGLVIMQLKISADNRKTLDIVRSVTDPRGKIRQEGDAKTAEILAYVNCTSLYSDGIFLPECAQVTADLDRKRAEIVTPTAL